MKKKMIVPAVSLLLLLCLLTACEKKKPADKENDSPKDSMIMDLSNQYQEEEITLPENAAQIFDLCAMEDNMLRMAGSDSESAAGIIWESNDGGNTWMELYNTADELSSLMAGTAEVTGIRLSATGHAVISAGINAGQDSQEFKYFILSSDRKELKELTALPAVVDEYKLQTVDTLNGSLLLGQNPFGQAYIIDPGNDSVTPLLSDNEQMQSYEYTDTVLSILTNDALKKYDLKTFKQIESETDTDFIHFTSEYANSSKDNGIGFAMLSGQDPETLYYACREGVFCFNSREEKKLVDGSRTAFANESMYLQELVITENEEIFSCMQKDTGSKIFKYTPAEAPREISKELTIFTLYENKNMEQAVNLYQKKHADTSIKVKVGIQNDNITASEAIKALNIEIAGGDMPDLLVLDGLNFSNYMKQNMLCDLKEVIDTADEEGALFHNIGYAYENDDGIYAVPTRFSTMLFVSGSKDKNSFADIKELADDLKKRSVENPETAVFDPWSYDQMVSVLYRCSMDEILNDGQADESGLNQFYESLHQIYQLADMSEVSKEEEKNMKNINLIPYPYNGVDLTATGDVQTAVDYASTFFDYQIKGAAENYAAVSIEPLKLNDKTYYVPQTIMGISSFSPSIDTAKEFLAFMLSEEAQGAYTIAGLPVNKNTFEAELQKLAETEIYLEGNNGTFPSMFTPYDKSGIAEIIQQIESISSPSSMDRLLMDIIMEQADNVLDGSTSVKDAASNAASKISLYLSE